MSAANKRERSRIIKSKRRKLMTFLPLSGWILPGKINQYLLSFNCCHSVRYCLQPPAFAMEHDRYSIDAIEHNRYSKYIYIYIERERERERG